MVACWYTSAGFQNAHRHSKRALISTTVAVRLMSQVLSARPLNSAAVWRADFIAYHTVILSSHQRLIRSWPSSAIFLYILFSRNGFHTSQSRHRGVGSAFRAQRPLARSVRPRLFPSLISQPQQRPNFNLSCDARDERVKAVGLRSCSVIQYPVQSVCGSKDSADKLQSWPVAAIEYGARSHIACPLSRCLAYGSPREEYEC